MVFQQAPPPVAAPRHYDYYPLTGAATMRLGAIPRGDRAYARYYFQWANRAFTSVTDASGEQFPRKPNIQPGWGGMRQQRTVFSSFDRADACTLAQTASVLGLRQRAQTYARRAGIQLTGEAAQADAPGLAAPDSCVIANGTLSGDAQGVLLDYEVQDGRSPDHSVAFLKQFSMLVHGAGKQAILLVNPLDSPGEQQFTGVVAANAHAVVNMFDLTTLVLWGANAQHSVPASYAVQKSIVAAGGSVDGKRLLINFELAGTTVEDAVFVGEIIRRDHLAGVMFWRDHAKQGGACDTDVNRKIAAIVFGHAGRGAK